MFANKSALEIFESCEWVVAFFGKVFACVYVSGLFGIYQ